MTYTEAKTRLERMLSSSDDPALSAAEIADLLAMARVIDVAGSYVDSIDRWQAASAYVVGDQVVPLAHNGFYYEVTVSDGLAGATEPTWPLVLAQTVAQDGVTYRCEGETLWAGAWDLSRAASEGWQWKAGKCASRFNFSSDVNNFQRSQLFEHCIKMADRYAGGLMTLEIGAGAIYDPVIGNLNGGN